MMKHDLARIADAAERIAACLEALTEARRDPLALAMVKGERALPTEPRTAPYQRRGAGDEA